MTWDPPSMDNDEVCDGSGAPRRGESSWLIWSIDNDALAGRNPLTSDNGAPDCFDSRKTKGDDSSLLTKINMNC